MDPVSAVGLVTAIIQLIETTAKVIGYVNDIKDAPTERAQFARHASSLLAMLTDLRYRVEEAKSASDPWFRALRGLGTVGGALDQLQHQMELLATKLKPSTGQLKKMGKALIWALDKKEVKEALAQIESVKSLIMLALQNDQFKLAQETKRDIVDVKKDIKGALEKATTERQDEEFQKVTRWLSSLDFGAKQVDFFSRRQAGTGEWLLSDFRFQHWLEGKERTLWCPGLPGAGKTTLASMVIDWLETQHQGTSAAVIYLYCNYKEEDVQTAENMIGSLLKQMVQQKAALPDGVRSLYENHQQKKTNPDLNDLTSLLIQEAKTRSVVFIVIDALDECPERGNTRGRLLAEIQKLPQNARTLITSRYSPKFEENFENVPHIEIRASNDDVKLYIEAFIEKGTTLAKHVRSDPTLLEQIISTVVEKSQGMFLLAQLHMENLAKRLNRRQVRAALDILPKELDEIYKQTMQRIQSQDEDQTALAHKVLYWILFSLRPLTTAQLQHALAVEPGDDDIDEDGLYETELMVSVCAGLVTINEENNQIRLVHYTTQSYFERTRTHWFPDAPSAVAKTCLRYLSFGRSGKKYRPKDVNKSVDYDNFSAHYPFMSYAARYWGDHVCDRTDDDISELACQCLSDKTCIENIVHFGRRDRFSVYRYRGDANLTGLHVVASFGFVGIARRLLEKEASVNDSTQRLFEEEDRVNVKTEQGRTPLHFAAAKGHIQMVRFLLKERAMMIPDANGETPLHTAAEAGHDTVVQALIDAGADVLAKDRKGKMAICKAFERSRGGTVNNFFEIAGEGTETERCFATALLPIAVNRGNDDNVKLMLEKRADPNSDFNWGEVVNRAVKHKNTDLLQLLLAHKARVNVKNVDNWTPLHYAAELGYDAGLRLLLDHGFSVHATDCRDVTPLHLAARYGSTFAVKQLLDRGARLDAEDYGGYTALKWVFNPPAFKPRRDIVDISYRYHDSDYVFDDDDEHDDDDGLIWQQREMKERDKKQRGEENQRTEGRLAVLDLLIEKGANLKAPLPRWRTYLLAASRLDGRGSGLALRRRLLEEGADVSALTGDGKSALYIATQRGQLKVVRLLLAYGADANQTCRSSTGWEGSTALHEAARCGREKIARVLIDARADVKAAANDGSTALHRAVNRGSEALVDLLLTHGVDINTHYNAKKRTILHYAVLRENVAMVRFLLQKGARIDATDADGKTALDWAEHTGDEEIISFLRHYISSAVQT